MLKVLYPYVAMPEKPQIAKALQDELGWEPILWVSPSNQHAEVSRLFPGVHLQTIADAFYGRPIAGVNSNNPHVPDAETIQRLQTHLPTMMAMMDYYGPPDAFLHVERVQFARTLLLQWQEVLSSLQPDIVFFEEAPHAPHTWALYALCLEHGIPTPFLMPTAVPSLSVLKDRVDGAPLRLAESFEWCSANSESGRIDSVIAEVATALREGGSFEHWYMRAQADATMAAGDPTEQAVRIAADAQRIARMLTRIGRWPHYARELPALLARRTRERANEQRSADQPSEWIILKHPGKPLGEPPFSLRDYEAYKASSAIRKDELRRDYLSRCSPPSPGSSDYVYFALHYQPERTTDSDGGVYRDQYLAVATLHEALPDGWLLYVKEHPSQFAATLHGDKGRTSGLYDDLQKLGRVRLIEPGYPSKRLTLGARAVATITGTLAWEAALNGVPALTFGYPWYEGCPGVHCVRGVEDARSALAHVASGERVDPTEMSAFLQALSLASFRVDLNAWVRTESDLTLEDQVAGVLSAMTWWMEHRFERG